VANTNTSPAPGGLIFVPGYWTNRWRLFFAAPFHRRVQARWLLIALLVVSCRPEDKFIFHPSAEIVLTPRHVGLEFQDLFFTTADGVRLHGWFIQHREADLTLVWFHGNAGNIGHRVENIRLLHDKLRINIFIFDYRGYGRSEGHISEAGTYRDGVAALEFVGKQLGVKSENLILFGRSLGAAVAAEMASRFDSRALILETPFVSIPAMAQSVFPLLPIGSLLQTRYDNLEKIAKIKVPLLVLHGDRDEVIPYEHGRRVFYAAPEPKYFYTISGASHNDTYIIGGDAYFQRLRSFIETVMASRP
jgi:uncharacterized protein